MKIRNFNKLLLNLVVSTFFVSSLCSCGLLIHGSKATLGLLNAPNDLEVKDKATGEKLKIRMKTIETTKSGNFVTSWVAPAVRVKARKGLELEFKSKNIVKYETFGYKRNIGFLIFEGLYTSATGSFAVTFSGNNINLVYTPPAVTFTVQPSTSSVSYCLNSTLTALSVAAISGGASFTYQWYSNTIASNTGGTLLSGATLASYSPVTTTIGTLYYYCVVTNTTTTTSLTSNVSGDVSVTGAVTPYISSIGQNAAIPLVMEMELRLR